MFAGVEISSRRPIQFDLDKICGDNQKGFDNYLYKKQIRPITAKDLVAKNQSPEVRAIYDRALKKAYEDQQKVLKVAAELSK